MYKILIFLSIILLCITCSNELENIEPESCITESDYLCLANISYSIEYDWFAGHSTNSGNYMTLGPEIVLQTLYGIAYMVNRIYIIVIMQKILL